MPAGVRVEARFCSKRCRQASSRHALRVRGGPAKASGRTARPTPGPPRRERHQRMRLARVAVADVIPARVASRDTSLEASHAVTGGRTPAWLGQASVDEQPARLCCELGRRASFAGALRAGGLAG
jgi:hypothetical protein